MDYSSWQCIQHSKHLWRMRKWHDLCFKTKLSGQATTEIWRETHSRRHNSNKFLRLCLGATFTSIPSRNYLPERHRFTRCSTPWRYHSLKSSFANRIIHTTSSALDPFSRSWFPSFLKEVKLGWLITWPLSCRGRRRAALWLKANPFFGVYTLALWSSVDLSL